MPSVVWALSPSAPVGDQPQGCSGDVSLQGQILPWGWGLARRLQGHAASPDRRLRTGVSRDGQVLEARRKCTFSHQKDTSTKPHVPAK